MLWICIYHMNFEWLDFRSPLYYIGSPNNERYNKGITLFTNYYLFEPKHGSSDGRVGN